MLQRKGGATMDQIMEATGRQKHTVRGFILILGSKGGIKVTKHTAGRRRRSRVRGVRSERFPLPKPLDPEGLADSFAFLPRAPLCERLAWAP